jgi:preprotein translocase subunit SecD
MKTLLTVATLAIVTSCTPGEERSSLDTLHTSAGAPGTRLALVEAHVARTTPAPGFVLTKSIADSSYYLQRQVVFDDRDITSARTASSTDGLALSIHLSPQGVARLNEATRAHVGERIAVLIQGRLNNAAPIRQRITLRPEQPLTMAVRLPKADADRFAAAVAARWPSQQ